MTKIDHLTKLEIVRLYKDQRSVASIHRHFAEKGLHLSRQAIDYHMNKYRKGEFDDGSFPSGQNSKAPKFKLVTEHDLNFIRQNLENQPMQSAQDIRRYRGVPLCYSTVRKAISAAGFSCSAPRYCQMIRDANKEKRVAFCKSVIEGKDCLDDVIFTDETSVQLHHNKQICYHPKGSIAIHVPKPKHPLKVHVWAGISRRGKTDCFVFDGIMDSVFFTNKILETKLLRFVKEVYPDGHRFQQDNDPKHTSRMVKQFLTENGINWWTWPAESPDLNPIEMVWSELKREVAKKNPTTQAELIQAILAFWETVTTEDCNRYIDHIFKVAPVCVYVKGRATGDIPNGLFTERSYGKSFEYFQKLLENNDFQKKLHQLLADRA